MSLHDGPGVRTTVFLKGCNMRCVWCHNPETFSTRPEIEYISDKCISCCLCTDFCESGVFKKGENGIVFDKNSCKECFTCVSNCYVQAINLIGKRYSVNEILSIAEQDRTYFNNSGGGVTISGGEPMMQYDYLLELLKELKLNGFHIAVETNMSFPWENYENILEYTDLVMLDLKIFNNKLHQEFTGIGNSRIIENIHKLDAAGKKYWIRTPIIPGINDSKEEQTNIKSFVNNLNNIEKYEQLKYHSLGDYKYQNLGIENRYKN